MVISPVGCPIEIRGETYFLAPISARALDYYLDCIARPSGEEDHDAQAARLMVLSGSNAMAVGSGGVLRILKRPETVQIIMEEAFQQAPKITLTISELLDVFTAWLKFSDIGGILKKLVAAGEAMIEVRDVLLSGAGIQTSSLTPPSGSAEEPKEPTPSKRSGRKA